MKTDIVDASAQFHMMLDPKSLSFFLNDKKYLFISIANDKTCHIYEN
jgi:hypothetical protein